MKQSPEILPKLSHIIRIKKWQIVNFSKMVSAILWLSLGKRKTPEKKNDKLK